MKPSNTSNIIPAKTIWLMGLSGAGKSTIAQLLRHKYFHEYVIIDGDELRTGICSDLGFSDEDRKENIFRAAHLCKLLNKQNIKVICCMMTPLEQHRVLIREIVDSFLFTAYISCSIEELKHRDTKGLYKKYDSGLIKNMSGLDLPFETPENPDVVVNTEFMPIHVCMNTIIEAHNAWGNRMYEKAINCLKK